MSETKIVGGAPTGTTFGVPGTEVLADSTFGAARVNLKPAEFMNQGMVGGHYTAAQVSGALTGAAAAGAVFSVRWSPPAAGPPYMVLKRVQLGYALTTAFTTGQVVDFDIVRCSAFTASDSGGTALTPFTGNSNKNRSTIMSTSQMADMRIASTAALTAGTKTQDANPFGYVTSSPINLAVPTATAAGGGMQLTDLYSLVNFGQHPQTFGNNEGFNIRVVTAMSAAGVIKLYVVVTWAEVPGL